MSKIYWPKEPSGIGRDGLQREEELKEDKETL